MSSTSTPFHDLIQEWRNDADGNDNAGDAILVATLEVAAEFGVEGLTTKRVSERAEMSTGIIHHHFGTKRNLIYQAFLYFVRRIHQRMFDSITSGMTPMERLRAFIDVQFSDEIVTRSAANIWVYFWYRSLHDAKVARLLRLYSRRFISNVVFSFLSMGFERREAQARALEFVSLIHGLWIEYNITGAVASVEQAKNILEHHLERIST